MQDSTKHVLSRVAFLIVFALAAGACGDSSSDSSSLPTSPSATQVTDSFSGTVSQNGSSIHTFSVTTAGYPLLAGYTSLVPNSIAALGLGIGAWDGSNCGLNQSQNDASRSGSTAISGTAAAGNYCIRVYDGGNVPEGVTVSYTVQVQHY